MKRALRVILPLILVFAIIGSTVWYLLVYDRDFTMDAILAAARGFDKSGNHKAAAWLYDLAYEHSGGGDDVAIELANHYKSAGNYTKAEYTLSNAIADGGTVDLYIALCQTYVEQDKLLDAVTMLDNIKDPAIKAQIDAMRPAAPTITPAEGFYSQYISVSATGSEGDTIYINYLGQYPSTQTDLYVEPYTLPEGETSIYAIAVDSQNLVSPLAIRCYTVGGIIELVELTDPVIDAAVRQQLNFSENRAIYTNDLWTLKELTLTEEVSSFEDLQYFPYLETLTLSACGEAELTAVSSLTKLTTLSITDMDLSQNSLKAIGSLSNLTSLTLSSCGLSSVATLEGLTELTYLDLSGNTLRNISVFAGFSKLEELHMSSNALTDLDALSGLQSLRVLDVSYNSLQSLSPIYSLTGLTTLKAGTNAIASIEGIGVLTNLQILDLSQNILTDISYLSGCTELTELDLSDNTITDMTVVAGLVKLLRLDLANNAIKELPEFPEGHALGSLIISNNQLSTIENLAALEGLYYLDIDYNAEVDSLRPLLTNFNLMQVNCFGTKIAISPFPEDQGVIVNLDPSVYYGE